MLGAESLLIRDALVVTLDASDQVHEAADVLIENGAIAAIGRVEATGQRVIDAAGKLLVPGFVNAHTHSPSTLIHGTGDRLSHPSYMWLSQAHTANKTPREIYVSAMLGCIQMLLSGTTAALDHFPGQTCTTDMVDAVLSAYRDSGMRAVLGLRFYDAEFGDIIPAPGTIPAEVADEMRRLNPLAPMPLADVRTVLEDAIARWHGAEDRLGVFPAPSNPERCSDEALAMCAEIATRHNLGIHTHLLESRVQAENARKAYGCTMVEHLDRLGLLGPQLSCAHAIWLEPADIERLAASGSVIVHNPESNMKIGAGTAPKPDLIERGARIALGTDGAGTNDNMIMHEALRLAAILHRPAQGVRTDWLSADDVLRLATQGGAAALLQADQLGAIEIGKRADLVLYRLDAPWWVPLNDPKAQLVFGENGSSVDTVIVDGRILVESGRITSFDAEAILAEARPMMAEILARNADLYALARRMAALFP